MSAVVARHRPSAVQNFTARKLAAVDRLLVDKRATDLDFRVFWYLVSAADRETGIARRKQQTIADAAARVKAITDQLAALPRKTRGHSPDSVLRAKRKLEDELKAA